MDTIKKLNIFDEGFKKLSELEINKKYKIASWKYISTVHGNKIVVHLIIDESVFVVFLPNRFNNLSFEDVELLNSETHHLTYLGTKENRRGFMHLVDID